MTAVQPKKPKLTPEAYALLAEALAEQNCPDPKTLHSLIHDWRSSPEWKGLANSTRRVWSGHLDLIEKKWGDKPITVWGAPRMVGRVVKWRNERASTPRTADIGVTVLRELLKFGRFQGRIILNVADGIPKLYKGGDRAEIIWTEDDIERFRLAAIELEKPHVYDGLRLAALTGLRRADLVSLTWDQVVKPAIVKTALKRSRGQRYKVTIPITPPLEKLLDELRSRYRKDGVSTVLVNGRGRSWTDHGFGGSFNAIRDRANIVHVTEGEDGNPVERRKHLHDLRGTFCTLLMTECSLTDDDVGKIMGWSAKSVAKIRNTYVDSAAVVVSLAERMQAKQRAKQSNAHG